MGVDVVQRYKAEAQGGVFRLYRQGSVFHVSVHRNPLVIHVYGVEEQIGEPTGAFELCRVKTAEAMYAAKVYLPLTQEASPVGEFIVLKTVLEIIR